MESEFSEKISEFYDEPGADDVFFDVYGHIFPGHKSFLEEKCSYFQDIFSSGIQQTFIKVNNIPVNLFKEILRYCYSQDVVFANISEHNILDLLRFAKKYQMDPLSGRVDEYLETIIDVKNFFTIFPVAYHFDLNCLKYCFEEFLDLEKVIDILQRRTFLEIDGEALHYFLKIILQWTDIPAIFVFKSIENWLKNQLTEEDEIKTMIIELINFEEICLIDLIKVVKPSGLFSDGEILKLIDMKLNSSSRYEEAYSPYLLPNQNVATSSLKSSFLGENKESHSILDERNKYTKIEAGKYNYHLIKEYDHILIILGSMYIINHIKMLLNYQEQDSCSYSLAYVIETSLDGNNWTCVVDYSQFLCKSWQNLHFKAALIKYIRIRGTKKVLDFEFSKTSKKRASFSSFEVVYFECSCIYGAKIDLLNNLVYSDQGIPLYGNKATVTYGFRSHPNFNLFQLTRDTLFYEWHEIHKDFIEIQLWQPKFVGSLRLRLWDQNDTKYSFFVHISMDRKNWIKVYEIENESSWQMITFKPRPVSFVRITGTGSSDTEKNEFRISYFQCPDSTMTLAPLEKYIFDNQTWF